VFNQIIQIRNCKNVVFIFDDRRRAVHSQPESRPLFHQEKKDLLIYFAHFSFLIRWKLGRRKGKPGRSTASPAVTGRLYTLLSHPTAHFAKNVQKTRKRNMPGSGGWKFGNKSEPSKSISIIRYFNLSFAISGFRAFNKNYNNNKNVQFFRIFVFDFLTAGPLGSSSKTSLLFYCTEGAGGDKAGRRNKRVKPST
jgi:hypothetical protein